MSSPVGKTGDIVQDKTIPPVLVGVAVGDIGECLVKMNGDGE